MSTPPIRWFPLLAFAGLCAASFTPAIAATAAPEFKETSPVAVPRERQFDFTSGLNHLPYRLMISTPAMEPGKVYPVLYVLDGNWYFRATADTALWGSGPFEPAIVVGICYPVAGNPAADYPEVRRRRGIDYTVKEEPKAAPGGSGGCSTFLRIMEEEVKPFIAAHYPVDAKRQMIYGKSLGGLAVVHALLSNPTAYSTYIAVSPAISQGDKAVLNNEAAFSARARAGELDLRILITSASEEEYTGTDPVKLAAEKGFFITNARGLAERLARLNPEKLHVKYVLFADEGHNAVSLASIGRGLTFALPAVRTQK